MNVVTRRRKPSERYVTDSATMDMCERRLHY